MRLLDRYRRIPKWIRAIAWLHVVLFLFLALGWGLVQHARRDVIATLAKLDRDNRETEEERLRRELSFTGFAWDKEQGPLFQFADPWVASHPIYLEWSLKHRVIVAVGLRKETMRRNQFPFPQPPSPGPSRSTPRTARPMVSESIAESIVLVMYRYYRVLPKQFSRDALTNIDNGTHPQ